MGTVFSGRWPMEGGAVTRGRGPGARGGGGRWPARGAVSPAVARRRPTAIFVRRDGRDSPRRTGSARAVAIDRREVLRRSSGAARKDSCTACERTAFTPCRRTHSAVHTRRRWREEPTSTWPNRRQPVACAALQPPRHPRQHPRAPPRRWSKPPTTPRAATLSRFHLPQRKFKI